METNQTNTRPISGLFVGNMLSFSDTVLTLVETEFPCVACVRTPALNDLFLIDKADASSIQFIVVDEFFLDSLTVALPRLRAAFPMASIVFAYRHAEIARKLLQQKSINPTWGSLNFLPMNVGVDSWLSILRLMATGECYVPTELMIGDVPAPAVSQSVSAPQIQSQTDAVEDDVHLTARELQVLESAAKGLQNKIIADNLNLSQHTVKLHMHHIIAKLGVHNRTEAANWFHGRKLGH